MKRNIILIAIIILVGGEASAKDGWGKFFKGLVGSAVSAVTGAVIEQTIEYSGYKPEEAKQMTHDLIEGLGMSTANVDRGIDYITASDKFIRQRVVSDLVFDKAIESNDNKSLIASLKEMSDAQLTFLSESQKATTPEEKQAAFNTRSKKYAEILFDTYELAKEQKAERLAEKLDIKQQLVNKGYNPEFADEIAGSILAVRSSSGMSEQEKLDYIKAFDFIQTPEQIEEVAEAILEKDTQQQNSSELVPKEITTNGQIQVSTGPTPEEIAAKEEAERLEKERKVKENAIESIQTTVINEYAFDDTDLNDEQKASLDKIAEVLIRYSELSLQIKGHTCNIGYESVNDRVGLRRAETAKYYLTEKGISADRISTSTGGEYEPIIENNSNENRKKNRRLTFIVR